MITGKLIKKMREDAGLTQERLAKAVGISQAHIAKIENEKVNPRLSTVNRILSILKTNKSVCKDLMTKDVIFLKPDDSVNHAVKLMKQKNISQIPIIENEKCIGSISERIIIEKLGSISGSTKLKDVMDEPLPIISCNDDVDVVKSLLEYHQAILVSEKGRVIGIITKSDFLNLLK